ncbi:hypothetical protein LINPERHAP1_LOCUS19608 [Linum perenne]
MTTISQWRGGRQILMKTLRSGKFLLGLDCQDCLSNISMLRLSNGLVITSVVRFVLIWLLLKELAHGMLECV